MSQNGASWASTAKRLPPFRPSPPCPKTKHAIAVLGREQNSRRRRTSTSTSSTRAVWYLTPRTFAFEFRLSSAKAVFLAAMVISQTYVRFGILEALGRQARKPKVAKGMYLVTAGECCPFGQFGTIAGPSKPPWPTAHMASLHGKQNSGAFSLLLP